jgi:manganese oxidase
MPNRVWILLLLAGVAGDARTITQPARDARPSTHGERLPRVSINDNRVAGGTLRGRQLSLRLVARMGTWYPDGDAAPGTPIPAFAEEGGAPLVPGPMIRVRAGTEVSVTVRNALATETLMIHGLTSRSGPMSPSRDSIELKPGETRTVRIRLDAPGTYYYWGTTMGRAIDERTREDAQLTGAIIVDPAEGPRLRDRVMVIGMWSDTSGRWFRVRTRMLVVVNGRSWPHTERLSHTVGDTIHWRVINSSADSHPMHLHGFYFHVDSRGDGITDSVYTADRRDMAVTDLMKPGATMSMTWSPERAGNWLFHCHLPVHFALRGSLGTPAKPIPHGAHGTTSHALQGMSGLVMGITVRERAGHPAPAANAGTTRRQLRLVIRSNADGSPSAPSFGFTLTGDRVLSADASPAQAAPALVLTRDEPVDVTVVNTLSEATAVHWHGIELESYYDGVAGFSGAGKRLSPVIAPGDSFVARFAPPRTGTFIYHTHIDEERQQPAGLAGPIVVIGPGEQRDPATDVSVVASSPRNPPDSGAIPRVVWLNGSPSPAALEWQAGVRYRIRFINMTTGIPLLGFQLSQNGKLVPWRSLAKDGADLPQGRRVMRTVRQPVSIGETADMEVVLEQEGAALITGHLGNGALVGTLPVLVRGTGTKKP